MHSDRRNLKSSLAFLMMGFAVLGVSETSVGTVKPVQLVPYPQKTRTLFRLEAPAVPDGVRSNASVLPVSHITSAVRATDGAIWLGTTQGLMRLDQTAPERDRRQYFAGRRYLSDDAVLQLMPDEKGGVWARTQTGVSHIEMRPMTLAQKAEMFESRIRARHDRYGLVADSGFRAPGDPSSNQLRDSDNDGLWTAIYAAAECFRFRVTRSREALANARKSVEAMLFLEEVAGRRGFPARSFVRRGDPMPQGGEWHWTTDGKYYWKGDTSSDEIVGHFFIYSIAYDLLPDAMLQRRIAQTTKRIMDHIIEHGYKLVGPDRHETTWGWWSPQKLQVEPDERGLNSLQLLSFLKTAAHITGEVRYQTEYRKAAVEWKYADWITRVNEFRQKLNYSDEELAMLPMYCLFEYERDPDLLKAYRNAADAWWKNIQREANPLWTFIYLKGTRQADIDLSTCVWVLYRFPMDMIEWTVKNSQRMDLTWASGVDREGNREVLNLLPPDERPVMRWNSNPFVVDGGDGGTGENDGAAFLLPYWLGRYQKLLLGE